jgi:hypothetical protein
MNTMKKKYGLMVFLMFVTFILAACGGSGNDTAVGPPKVIFVTSATGDGDLSGWTDAGGNTGVAAADSVCQTAATAAGLPGTYMAWLSDSTTDAYCHVQGFTGTVGSKCGQASLPIAAGPWIRTDGYPFAPAIDKLINNGQVFAPVRFDENGTAVATGDNDWYFTNTNSDGTQGAANCQDWTSNSNLDSSALGQTAGATTWWTQVTGTDCTVTARLLCVQTGAGGPLPSITAPALSKKVFVTSTTYQGNLGGISGADAICQARASAGGVANPLKFKAWLSDGVPTNAISRFTFNGPWARLDGVKVADDKTALTASGTSTTPLFTAIPQTEAGVYVLAETYSVWTGTGTDGNAAGPNCVSWGSSLITDSATIGDAHTSDGWWTNFTTTTCDQYSALYCFEDN